MRYRQVQLLHYSLYWTTSKNCTRQEIKTFAFTTSSVPDQWAYTFLTRRKIFDMQTESGLLETKVKTLADFNHFFSNIGYIAFGLIFLILVRWFVRIHTKDMNSNDDIPTPILRVLVGGELETYQRYIQNNRELFFKIIRVREPNSN